MPRLSDGMEEGTIIVWLKESGDFVRRGEEIVEIETDKADMAFESPFDGKLAILVQAGATVPIGTPIATVGEGSAPDTDADRSSIRVDDEPAAPAVGAEARTGVTVVDLTRTQALVATRMSAAKESIPDFTVSIKAATGAIAAERERRRAVAQDVPSVNDFVVWACARALREFPKVNGSYRDGQWVLHEAVNIGIAVATDDDLIVPTLRDAADRAIGEIAAESRRLAERVRSGDVTPPELSGATFTVSNLGMFGIDSFTAIINPPQAAILAVGGIDDGRVTLTLTCDHRILYGADAARFLARVRVWLEGLEGI